MMSSCSLRKHVVGSNIINRSVNRCLKNTNDSPFTRSVIQALGSRLFNTGTPQNLLYARHLLNKYSERYTKRNKQIDSSDGLCIVPSRVKDDAQRLCLYFDMPGVLEEDLKVSVEHESIVVKGRLNEKAVPLPFLRVKNYYCWFDSEYIDRFKLTHIKAEMKRESGVLKLTIPKLKQEEVTVFNVKVNYKDETRRGYCLQC